LNRKGLRPDDALQEPEGVGVCVPAIEGGFTAGADQDGTFFCGFVKAGLYLDDLE